jgi:malate dehydrogenase (oxaloacetate-decarboxylating)(NADP+)
LNALEIAKKKIGDVKIVLSGAGASAVSCAKLYLSLGAKKENIVMTDSHGVLHISRELADENKKFFATSRNVHTLEEAMHKADVFIGLSKGNIVSKEMVKSMAKNAIVFALANPDPEITYDDAIDARPDIIIATGRSDYPNQVNNVLGFPFIFRGALDVRATRINEEMKLAAVRALAGLAKEAVPEMVNLAYNKKNITFGKEYIIPKPLDPRLITTVAPAVANAAMSSGVAQSPITNWNNYVEDLSKRLGHDNKLLRIVTSKAKQNPQRIVFAEADTYKILKAAQIVRDEGIAKPILLGNLGKISRLIEENNLDLGDTPIIDPRLEEDKRHAFGEIFFRKRKRRGFTLYEAKKIMNERNYYGAMMVESGEADAMISGLTRKYSDTIRPALQIIGTQDNVKKVAGMYIMVTKKGPFFFADTTINVNPTTEDLVEITVLTAWAVQQFNIKPRIALLSFSNFGANDEESARKMRDAVAILHKKFPGMMVDGEMQANFALNPHLLSDNFPFCEFSAEGANTLIFPNLDSGNIAYKLLQEMGSAEAIGPILLGLRKPVHILQLGSSVREIVNMVAIAVVDAQSRKNSS